jgi:hypothetical protein
MLFCLRKLKTSLKKLKIKGKNMSRPTHLRRFNPLNILDEGWKLQKFSLPNFFPSCNLPFLRSKYIPQHLLHTIYLSQPTRLLFPHTDQVSHSYKTSSSNKKMMTAFWDIASCSLVKVGRRFTGAYCLHHQGNE